MRERFEPGRFVDPSKLHSELTDYFAQSDLKVGNKQLTEFFQHFRFNPEFKIDMPHVADCLFTENFTDFVARHTYVPRLAGNIIDKTDDKENLEKNQTSIETKKGANESTLPIIHRLEAKIFLKNKTYFDTFKEVDADRDGFISKKDFQNYMKTREHLSEADAEKLFNYFGGQKTGGIPFSAFASKLYQNDMYQSLVETEKTTNIMGLRQFDASHHLSNIRQYHEKIEGERKKFRISCPNDNCKLTSLLRQKQVQIHTGLRKHLPELPAD
jgi:hypothetical protein